MYAKTMGVWLYEWKAWCRDFHEKIKNTNSVPDTPNPLGKQLLWLERVKAVGGCR